MDTISTFSNPLTQEQFDYALQQWPKSLSICCKRASLFSSLQQKVLSSTSLDKEFIELETHTKLLEPLLRTPTEVEQESYGQVCFTGNPLSSFNSIPFALFILSVYKSYFIPAFGILLPLLSWILPYILLKAFYTIPITFTEYTAILWRLWNGQGIPKSPSELLKPVVDSTPKHPLTQLKQLVQNGWTLFTIGQSLLEPVKQARHFIKTETACIALGTSICRVREIGETILTNWSSFVAPWMKKWITLCPSSPRQAFAFAINHSFWLPTFLKGLCRFEVLYSFASYNEATPAQFVKGTPTLYFKGVGDPSIPTDERVLSDFSLHKTHTHAVITGPNRGGKSSFMRGVLWNVKLAHIFGCVLAKECKLSYFSWIADGLKLEDLPGTQSLFEREVAFAAGVLQKNKGTGLVLYDELFHSTNPPDAIRTSNLFCSSLWQKKNCISLISTHVYSLARSASPESVKQYCIASWKKDDKYIFSYKVQKGICEVSSVDYYLKQFGLLSTSAVASTNISKKPEQK